MTVRRLLILSFFLVISACSNVPTITTLPDPVSDHQRSSSAEGVTLILPETIFQTSPTTIKAIVQNDGESAYDIGDFYHIEVKRDGEWYIVTYSDKVFFENRRFKDYGRTLHPTSTLQQTFSVEALGIELPSGEYRLVKSFSPKEGIYYKISIAIPFTVK